jgi:hypothetical protein
MMLANTILKLKEERLINLRDTPQIIRKVMDHISQPFSIHQVIKHGQLLLGKEPGDWYGVNSITQVVQQLFDENQKQNQGYDELFCKLDFIAI